VNDTPVVMNTCYSFVTAKDVIHVASVHQYDAGRKDLQDGAGSGGVSRRCQPGGGPLRAELGRQHLGRL
jgi:hypothetical protein